MAEVDVKQILTLVHMYQRAVAINFREKLDTKITVTQKIAHSKIQQRKHESL